MAAASHLPRVLGRYAIFDALASGGMATVHLGKVIGEAGFCRTVAIKRLHESFVKHPLFVAMMTDEARLVSRIRHPNVVPTLDVVALEGELFVIMEYVHGASLSELLFKGDRPPERVPTGIACAIVVDVLHGLHAAHEATSERGEPLGIVHRDVSPQNILVGVDGVARVLDFGVAKASGRVQSTDTGQIKGKLAYMAPEQMIAGAIDRRVDVYAAGIVLWEALTGRRLFDGENQAQIVFQALSDPIPRPSTLVEGLSEAVDEVVMTALDRERDNRFPTAQDFALSLERATGAMPRPREIGAWVHERAKRSLEARARTIAAMDSVSDVRVSPAAGSMAPERGAAPTAVAAATLVMPASPAAPVVAAPPERPARGRYAIAIGAALVASVGIVALVAFALHARAASRALAGATPAAAPSAVVSAETVDPPPPPDVANLAPLAPIAPREEASAAATHAGASSQVATPGRAPASASAPRESCNPPYRIDASGVKVPKRECFVRK